MPTRVRDEPDATGVVLEACLVQRGDAATVALGPMGFHGLSPGGGRIGRHRRRVDSGRSDVACDGEAGEAAAGSHLIGDLAVDGAIEAHRLDIAA